MKGIRDAWLLIALLIGLVAFTVLSARDDLGGGVSGLPSSYSSGKRGLLAFHRLLLREGFQVRRFEQPATHLPKGPGLLVLCEPLERPFTDSENDALMKWIDAGGYLLLGVQTDKTARDGKVPLEAVRVDRRSASVSDARPDAPGATDMEDVRVVRVSGRTVLHNDDEKTQESVLSDADGVYAVRWLQGKGGVVVVTSGCGLANEDLSHADNPVFLTNIARTASGPERAVWFDEYHQGFGSARGGRTLWQAIGAPGRSAAWFAVCLFALYVVCANRRFGAPVVVDRDPVRHSTEYIASMAGFLQRSGAPEIALEQLYRSFVRMLAHRLVLAPGADPSAIAAAAEHAFGWSAPALEALLRRCEKVAAGAEASEAEAARLAIQLSEYTRRAQVGRHA